MPCQDFKFYPIELSQSGIHRSSAQASSQAGGNAEPLASPCPAGSEAPGWGLVNLSF